MKAAKRILVGLVVLIAAVLAAGYAILANLDFENLRALAQDTVEEATGRELVIGGPIDLRISFEPSISLNEVSFANASWGSRPDMARVKRFELEVKLLPLLSGDIAVKRLVAVEPDILLETDASGAGNWVLETADKAQVEGTLEAESPSATKAPEDGAVTSLPSVNRLSIRDGRLTFRDGQSGEERVFELGRLEGSSEGIDSDLALELEGRYNDIALSAVGSLGPLSSFASGAPFPLELAAKAAGASLTVKGTVRSADGPLEIDLDLAASGTSLADLNALAGGGLPALGPYEVATKLSGAGARYSFKGLSLLLGRSDLSGNLDLALDGARPRASGSFVAKLIDLADFVPKAASSSAAAAPAGGTAGTSASASPFVFTPDPLPLDGLKAADAALKLSAQTLKLPNNLEMQGVDITLNLEAGKLLVAPVAAQFSGGRIESAVSLDAAQPVPPLVIQLNAREIDYGRLLKDLDVDDSLAGKLDLTLDLKGQGRSLRGIASSATGLSELVSQGGTINNRVFTVLAVGLGEVMGPLLGNQQQARVNCVVTRFDFRDGVGRSRGLVFDSESLSVTGQGHVDLKSERLNLDFDTETRQSSLSSLAIPFQARGTLKSPEIIPDPAGAAAGVVGAVTGSGTSLDSLGGLVSGLLGGDSGSETGSPRESPCIAALTAKPAPAAGGGTTSETQPTAGQNSSGSSGGALDSLGEALDSLSRDLNSLFGGD